MYGMGKPPFEISAYTPACIHKCN